MGAPANRPETAPRPAPAPTLRVLQVCPADLELCRALDTAGVSQQIVTSGAPRSPRRRRWGLHGEIHRVATPAGARRLFGLAAAPLVAELAGRADLVHVHPDGDPSALAAALWAAHRRGLPALVDLAPKGRRGLTAGLPRAFERRLLDRADALLCPDDATLQRLAECGLPREALIPLPRPGSDAAGTAPEIRWGALAADLLGTYRRVRRRAPSGFRGGAAGRPLAKAAGEGR